MKGVKRPNQPLSTWEVPLEKGKRGRSDGPAFGPASGAGAERDRLRPAERQACARRSHVTPSPVGAPTHARRVLHQAAAALVAVLRRLWRLRRWECHLRLDWRRLWLMALSRIHRQVSWGGRPGIRRSGGYAGHVGPTVFQAALGPGGLPLPPCLRPGLASPFSCRFLSPSHLLGGAGRGFFS